MKRTTFLFHFHRALASMACILACLLPSACGYRFTPDGGDLPGEIRTVFVPVFRNDTSEVGMGAWCTDALRLELARRNREGGEASDGRIEGRILEVRDPTAIYTTDRTGKVTRTSARVYAVVEIRLLKGGELLRSFRIRGTEDYMVSSALGSKAVMEDDAARRLALQRLSRTLMMEAMERLQTF